jgi:hypothetical protein
MGGRTVRVPRRARKDNSERVAFAFIGSALMVPATAMAAADSNQQDQRTHAHTHKALGATLRSPE